MAWLWWLCTIFSEFWYETKVARRGWTCMESYSGQTMLTAFNLSIFRFDSVSPELVSEFSIVSGFEQFLGRDVVISPSKGARV